MRRHSLSLLFSSLLLNLHQCRKLFSQRHNRIQNQHRSRHLSQRHSQKQNLRLKQRNSHANAGHAQQERRQDFQ